MSQDETLRNTPEDIDQYVQQGEERLANEQWQDALIMFDLALVALHPAPQTGLSVRRGPQALTNIAPTTWANAFNGRGVALLELGRLGEAVAAFGAAIELNPLLADAYFNRAMVYEAQGIGRFVEALTDYDKAIELEPFDAEFYFRRGGLFFMNGDYERAAADNTKVLQMHQSTAEAEALVGPYIARGLSYYQLNQLNEAISDYGLAVAIDPRGAAEAYFYRALAYIDQEQALSARADLQAFLNLTPEPQGEMAAQAREISKELDKL